MRRLWFILSLIGTPAGFAAVQPDAYFEPNRGQADASIAFVARGPGYAVLLHQDGRAAYRFPGSNADQPPLEIKFAGGPAGAEGEQPLASVTNYYGGPGDAWLPDIPHFQRARFRGIYPGIDLVWRAQGADLEYEFLARAGADPGSIRIQFSGADRVSVDAQGNLTLETPFGKIQHRRPMAWQEIAGRRQDVAIALHLDGSTAHFELGAYDRRRPLRIDPVLAYSTYVGGAGDDAGYAIAVDSSGGVYMTGTTASIGFPAAGSGVNCNGDAFVMKFDESGTLLYNTVLASNGNTSGQAIAVDLAGNAYVAGTTEASNFPATKGAWQTVFGGVADAFAAKLDATGKVIYASYIGGAGQETGTGIAIDAAGNAYVSGYTSSSFPTTSNAAQKLYGGGFSDAFLVKVNSAGSAPLYSTLLGGTGNDLAEAVAVDAMGHACIAGYTDSANLAVQAPLQPLPGGEGDALIACLSIDGSAWTMISYLGGSNLDEAYALEIDPSGDLYVAGTTFSPDFPVTAGVLQTVNAGGYDAFVAKLSPGGASLTYATYLGGNGSDAALALAVGSAGDVWIGGYTLSTNFPLAGAWQSVAAGSFDGFIAHLSSDAGTLLTSSYLGGTGDDRVMGIAVDRMGLVFATGATLSTDFPVTPGALQTLPPAGMNAFLVNIDPSTYTISGQVSMAGSGLSGVAMQLSGSQDSSASTDSSGYYSLTVPAGGTYLITPLLSGYAFGPQNQSYADLSSNQTANFTASSGTSFTISGQVTLSGSGLSGTSMELSGSESGTATTDASGKYSFSVPSGGTYTITPTLTGFSFTPPGTTFGNMRANQTASFAAQCGASLSPSAVYLDSTSQAGPILNVTAAAGCGWSASGGGFVSITTGASGTGNGSVSFTVTANTSGAVRTGSITLGSQTVTVTQRTTAAIFTDVMPPAYYFDFAGIMHQAGITAGCSSAPLQYCPDETTTRGQMAVFLITAIESGNSFGYTTAPYFTDVPSSSPYFKFVQKLRDLGITSGCTATAFCPDDAVTRGEMAVFIIASRYRTTPYTYPSTPYFTDVPSSSSFFPFVQKMAQTGITAGCGTDVYCPNQTLTRGQMAVFIVTGLLNELLPAGTPLIGTAIPYLVTPGEVVTVTLTGKNTHFLQGSTQVIAPAGVTASNVTVLSGTSLTVQLAIGASVPQNPTTIVVTTGTEEAALPNGLLIQ